MSTEKQQSPWTHRWLVRLFSLVLGVLIFWLLNFVVDDIESLSGPDYSRLEQKMLDPELVEESDRLGTEIANTERRIEDQRRRQQILRDSTDNSQKTMNQLLQLQRLSLEKGLKPSDQERAALAESEQLFLDNQRHYQKLNEQIAELYDHLHQVKDEQETHREKMNIARAPVQEEFRRLVSRHEIRLATLQLVVLTPLLIVGVVLYLKYRMGAYGALVYAFGLAVLAKVGFVMHEYFPKPYFKYILIAVAIWVTLRVLIALLRMVAFPKSDWLVQQYREAYEGFMCPRCDHPIRRGPLKYMSWTRRSIKRLVPPVGTAAVSDQPYTCPACSTRLYESCSACGAIRHSLLPACETCGANLPIGPATERGQ